MRCFRLHLAVEYCACCCNNQASQDRICGADGCEELTNSLGYACGHGVESPDKEDEELPPEAGELRIQNAG